MPDSSPTPDPRTDSELVRAINAGEDDAFEALYRRYRDWVHQQAYRQTGDHDAALDVVQDTFLYLVGKVPHLRLTASVRTFLYPVVKHLAQAARRKAGRFHSDADALAALPAPSQEPRSRADLIAALSGLPESHREVVLMRFADDMTLPEIAAALKIPVGTVKSRLHNSLHTLRQNESLREYF
jgi:RNA polymerase sigma-70 factor, ECF subfamily